jgi:para-nitrobenzyl esterase
MNTKYLQIIVLLVIGLASCKTPEPPKFSMSVVRTEGGLVSGTSKDSVYIFKGVPFAAPPINDLRWKEPQPLESWEDTLACTTFAPSPMQNDPKPFMMWSEEFIAPPQPLSEDCLYLNIWTAAKSPDAKLPVLVWIYGGGFTSGSGACAVYDGEGLAREGIVYVTINYRVGIFGFMAHGDLTSESPHKSSGNYGLMDQIAALRWIQNNIAAFGGDPGRVTIAGQSAGSMSVQALVASPLTKGLFHGAIAQSGAIYGRPAITLDAAEKVGLSLSEKLGSSSVAALRQLPADSLLSLANTQPFGSFFPITDGYVIPEDVNAIFAKKRHQDVPVIAGWVTGDGALAIRQPKSAADFKKDASKKYGSKAAEFMTLFPADDDEVAKASQSKLGLLQFAGSGDSQWAVANTNKTFLYEFSYVPTDKPGFPNYGAFHTSDVPFALHTLSRWERPWKESDYKVEKYMSGYWINFVKNGDPNGNGLPEWKNYDAGYGAVMEFGAHPELKPALYKSELDFLALP